ncbi:gas vesicle protein [Streptomyces sp. NRRL B-24484]|uniref:gas vesicle protein n=1 Tax=Streptomyces sp. NRRL B-24484 TaxID=1463833 RepID=UPI0005BCBA3D|nr:gas vesicle protein [Streptomyces sp. NRRL B-24484]
MTGAAEPVRAVTYPVDERRIALVDLLDRLLAGGVVVAGEITLSIADVDLVRISLRALIASVGTLAAADEEHAPQRQHTPMPYTGEGP